MSRELSPWAEPPDDGDHDGLEAHWDRRIEQDGGEHVAPDEVLPPSPSAAEVLGKASPEPD